MVVWNRRWSWWSVSYDVGGAVCKDGRSKKGKG